MTTDPAFVRAAVLGLLLVSAPPAAAREPGRNGWAAETDPVARQLIAQERKWATLGCAPSATVAAATTAFVEDFIAPDFVGTSPEGSLYRKADMLPKKTPDAAHPERDCKLISARVRYFGPDVAVIYGRESAVLTGPNGKTATRTLVWTDTLLKRAGKWQIVAVQDMAVPTK